MTYGLIGKKLSHSYSPMIHHALDNNAYQLMEIAPEALDTFLEKADFSGINVTIPYKKDVIPFCTELTEAARKIGCVNTIVNRGGRLIGHNTDYDGFLYMARRANIDFSGKKVLILGSGGTSLTATHAAVDSGAREVIIVSRGGAVNYDNLYHHKDADILVNTTPVGMYPNNEGSLVNLDRLPKLTGIIDVIYNPLRTNLLLDAKQRKIPHTNGLSMLVAQAVFASGFFFNKTYDDSIIEEITLKIQNNVQNIVLVGMPGCGKSSIGKALADLISREFIDTDTAIEQFLQAPPSHILETYGEDYFRDIESNIVAQVAKSSRSVISTGGGVPIREENRRVLMQNSFVCFIERPLDQLDVRGRPLSKQGSLEVLYQRRLPFYRAMCDIMIQNTDTVAHAVQQIVSTLQKQRINRI